MPDEKILVIETGAELQSCVLEMWTILVNLRYFEKKWIDSDHPFERERMKFWQQKADECIARYSEKKK